MPHDGPSAHLGSNGMLSKLTWHALTPPAYALAAEILCDVLTRDPTKGGGRVKHKNPETRVEGGRKITCGAGEVIPVFGEVLNSNSLPAETFEVGPC